MKRESMLLGLIASLGTMGCHKSATVEEYLSGMARVECGEWVGCGFFGASQAAFCRHVVEEFRGRASPYLREAVDAGRITIDAEKLRSCIELTPVSYCWTPRSAETVAACSAILVGRVPIGGACRDSSECSNGYCDARGKDGWCMGSCKAFVATGGDCAQGSCASSDECDSGTMTCRRRHTGGPGAACTKADDCQRGLTCHVPAIGAEGTCAAPSPAGAACVLYDECAPGLYCDAFGSGCTAPGAVGASCNPGRCGDGLACTSISLGRQACQKIHDVGQSCDPLALYPGCPQRAPCNRDTKTCTAIIYAEAGDDCTRACFDGPFDAWLFCDDTGKCAPFPRAGEPCTPLTFCYGGTCDPVTKRCGTSCR